MTKSEKLRKAAKVCWALGAFFTWSFVKSRLTGSGMEPAVLWVVALAASLGLQYVLTLVESTIIEGMLPAPWNLNFKEHATLSILAIAAYGCFLFDVLLNLGGVYTFTADLSAAVGNVKQLGISDYVMQVVQFVATFFFSMLFALGSELLEALADHYDGKVRRPSHKFGGYSAAPQEHNRQPQQQQMKTNKQLSQQEIAAIKRQAMAEAAQTTASLTQPQSADTPFKERLAQNRAARQNARNF